jgi:hypothetical protein
MPQRWTDQPMFPDPEPEPLGAPEYLPGEYELEQMRRMRLDPSHLVVGDGPVKYANHGGVNNAANRCDDCLALLAEWHSGPRTTPMPPPARHAKFKRTQGKSKKLLCAEHKTNRIEKEEMKR